MALKEKLCNKEEHTLLNTEVAHMAQSYISSYRQIPSDLKKHHVLLGLRNNNDVMLLKPDTGNGIVITDKQIYKSARYLIINDTTKFKPLSNDVTLLREWKLQRFLRK